MKGCLKSFLLIKFAGACYTYVPCFRLAFSLLGVRSLFGRLWFVFNSVSMKRFGYQRA
ncbi:hypothetical protein HMPREF1415_00596 [Helicobacter pylori GAM254Ai]|nr:hypothetical protein HMPREF1415_00596 [Helicobacter pylori GAM254Ai]